jgi:ADP-heptose:LPS heptosyltransferase
MKETILIFRIGSLGDTVVALPCFHRIARSFPNARRILVTDTPASAKAAPAESVVGGTGLIDDVIYFPPPPRRWRDFARLRAEIRRTGARTLVYVADRPLGSVLRDVLFFRAAGLRQIIGSPLARDLRRLRVDRMTGDTEREAERLVRCLAPLGPVDLDDPGAWDLRLQASELRTADTALAALRDRDFIAANLGGKVGIKDWGNDNWATLINLVAASQPEMGLVFVGSADEAERSAAVASHWPGPMLNLCGQLSPRESAAVMQRAALFVGHDSGPLHLAAAAGTACVGIYGDHNMPKWWHPMGKRHRILHDMRGVRSIAPAQVHDAIDGILAETNIVGSRREAAE